MALVCHADTVVVWVTALRVKVRMAAEGILDLEYRLDGDLSRARIPSPLTPERVEGLWCQTCFEVFVGRLGRSDYLEYNLAPSGHWQAYAFSDYRQNRRLLSTDSPSIRCSRQQHGFSLQARVCLPKAPTSGALRLGLCSVLEDMDGRLSHWALRRSTGAPDFHDASTFVWETGET